VGAAGSTAPIAAGASGESLRVVTVPAGARVMIDGSFQRRRSPATYGDLRVGDHAVLVEKPDYVAQQQHVRVEAGRTAQLTLKLARASEASRADAAAAEPAGPSGDDGHVEVRVEPFATFYVDGKVAKSNVVSLDVPLSPGPHTIRAVHPRLGAKEWKVTVRSGRTEHLSHNFLTSDAGRISITSGKDWAHVYFDGKDAGKTTPCVIEGLPPGTYTVSLVRDGFVVEGGEKSVTVQAGATSDVSFTLKQRKK
jgi:hypothetical protein